MLTQREKASHPYVVSPERAKRPGEGETDVLIQLEPEQAELLSTLCEAASSVTERQSFLLVAGWQTNIVKHPGFAGGAIDKVHRPDVETLANADLLHVSKRGPGDNLTFDVTPAGTVQWREREKQTKE